MSKLIITIKAIKEHNKIKIHTNVQAPGYSYFEIAGILQSVSTEILNNGHISTDKPKKKTISLNPKP